MTSDSELLQQFARGNSQDAFAEIVRRHLNLVYSAALRQVRSPQLAEEIAQSVFADLARSGAGVLPVKETKSLAPWLYSVTRRTAIDVIRKESRRQLREQIAVEMQNMNATANDWTQIEPLLDDAMAALDETDRAAILLRYFENKNLREVGESLNISDDAAQKRVSRAVEKLREFFSKQKITIGASGLVVLISANAVQSAPVGLSAKILAAISGITATAGITMIHKIIITGFAAVAIGSGIYSFYLQKQIGALQQQQASLNQQIAQLSQERDDLKNQLTALQLENEKLRNNENELLKLRAEMTRLQRQQNLPQNSDQTETNNPFNPIEVHTKAKFIFMPPEDVQFLNISWTTDADGIKTGLIDENQFKLINEAMSGADDVKVISAPQVITGNGMQAEMSISRAVPLNGTNVNVGETLNVTPFFSTNFLTFNLNLVAQLTQLTGDFSNPNPQMIQMTNKFTLSAGQTAVFEREIPGGSWMPDETNAPAGPRSLLIFITPQAVDLRNVPATLQNLKNH